MDKKIRELVHLYGKPFIENFSDISDDSNKSTACELILNNIEYKTPFEKISKILIRELTNYILANVEKEEYDLDTIEESFTHLVLLCSFPEYNMKANRNDLMRSVDWETIFWQLGD